MHFGQHLIRDHGITNTTIGLHNWFFADKQILPIQGKPSWGASHLQPIGSSRSVGVAFARESREEWGARHHWLACATSWRRLCLRRWATSGVHWCKFLLTTIQKSSPLDTSEITSLHPLLRFSSCFTFSAFTTAIGKSISKHLLIPSSRNCFLHPPFPPTHSWSFSFGSPGGYPHNLWLVFNFFQTI